jgi:hypothetical protein
MGVLLNLFDKLIVEHGSAAVKGDHIALLREQLQTTEKQLEKLETENKELKERLLKYEEQSGEKCPKCRKPSFSLTSSKPDRDFGDMGLSNYLFSCSDCGFTDEISAESAGKAWRTARGH